MDEWLARALTVIYPTFLEDRLDVAERRLTEGPRPHRKADTPV